VHEPRGKPDLSSLYGTWSVSYISKDIISMKLSNHHSSKNIHIFNVYNEVCRSPYPKSTLIQG